jgi:hypothetical protein
VGELREETPRSSKFANSTNVFKSQLELHLWAKVMVAAQYLMIIGE